MSNVCELILSSSDALGRRGQKKRFTSREVLRLDRTGLATIAELNPALALLEEGM